MTPDLIRYKYICKIYQEAYFHVVLIFTGYLLPKKKIFKLS